MSLPGDAKKVNITNTNTSPINTLPGDSLNFNIENLDEVLDISNLTTTEIDVTKVMQPDGSGGTEFTTYQNATEDNPGQIEIATQIETNTGTDDVRAITPLKLVTYVTASAIGLLDYKGSYDANTNSPDLTTSPNATLKGDTYTVTVAGTFFTESMEVGDMIIAEIDDPSVLDDWTRVNKNLDLATTTIPGIVELATQTEVNTGTDTGRVLTPNTFENSTRIVNSVSHIANSANPHSTDIGNLGTGTLAELNAVIIDATLDDSSASRPPNGSAGGDLVGTYPNPTVVASSTTVAGKIEIATQAEADTGTDNTRTITPLTLANYTGTLNPGLTNGSILFQGASGITEDNTNLYYNDTDNNMAIGGTETSFTLNGIVINSKLSVHTVGATDLGGFTEHRHSDVAALGSHFVGVRSRGTEASETAVQNNDVLLRLDALGHDGTDYEIAGQIDIEVDGVPGANDMPGRIIFKTTPDGSNVPIEALRIDNTAKLRIGSTGSLTNEGDLYLNKDGILALAETTTPTADGSIGKVYTKNDNVLYFQDGAGVEKALISGSASTTAEGAIELATQAEVNTGTDTTRAVTPNTLANYDGGVHNVSWPFASPSGSSGTFYYGGYYDFAGTDNDFSPSVNWGTANSSYAAHFMVVLGAVTVDELTITVTGTRIQDNGTRTTSYVASIVIPNSTAVDTYFETPEKFIGQVTVAVSSGTAKTCNYGWCKYWDNRNTDYSIEAIEALWLGGGNDANPDIALLHHKTTGWTFNVGSTPTPPTAITRMSTIHSTEKQVVNNEQGAFKVTGLSTSVNGSGNEGVIWEVVTTANNTFELGSLMATVKGM